MGLFGFFKKKHKLEGQFTKERSLGEILNQGVLFEDQNKLLRWGSPINELTSVVDVKEKKFADRTVYNWGEHEILGGLKLELSTMYWNHREHSIDKRFNAIEFLAVGDDNAGKYLRLIGQHLEKNFGAGRHIEDEPLGYFEWYADEVRITLCFMQQVANKLHFKIEKL